MKINNEIQVQGEFWLPNDIERKIPGKLLIEDGGRISLHLDNLIQDPDDTDIIDTIWGVTNNQVPVTLFRSFAKHTLASQLLASIALLQKQNYPNDLHVQRIIIGNNYHDIQEINIKEGNFYLDYKPFYKTDLLFDKIEIIPRCLFTAQVISEKIKCTVTCSDYLSLERFLDIWRIITYFFCFISYEIINTNCIDCTDSENNDIKLFHQSVVFSPSNQIPNSRFIEFNELENQHDVLKRWVELYNKHTPALNIFLAVLINPPKFTESKFLLLTQALESFHRTSDHEQIVMSKSELKKLRKFLRNELDKSEFAVYKNRVNVCLAHCDEVSFRERINKLFSEIIDAFPEHENIGELVSNIVEYRNNLTHVIHDENNQVIPDKDILYALSQKIEGSICLLLINKLFNKDEAKKYFKHRRVLFALNGGTG